MEYSVISMKRWIFLRSSPGKRALPVISSAMMQPTDQMSTGIEKQRLWQLRLLSMIINIQKETYMLRGFSGDWFVVALIGCTGRTGGTLKTAYSIYCIEHIIRLDVIPIVNNCVKYTV